MQKKLVIFGAGKIGRSFIGQLFGKGGYDVVFIDVDKRIVDELNRRGNYNVVIKAEKETVINISNVRGIFAMDESRVEKEIFDAGILAVSVGQNGLPHILPLIAKGLAKRYIFNNAEPLDIIIAENLRNAAQYFREELGKRLPVEYPIDQLVGLIETSIGKMVPIMRKKDLEEDILQVFAEPYNTLILDKKGFKNPIPQIEGLSPKENMKAWVDRKLFIHNLGHATAAYIGYLYNPGFIYLYEALAVPEVFRSVRETMIQSANILLKLYPEEFAMEALIDHIDDLLSRFANKHLGDTIFRVGCDLTRKLGPEDRLVGAVSLSQEFQMPCDHILFAIACACRFMATDENGNRLHNDQEFDQKYSGDVRRIMTEVSGFDEMNIIQSVVNIADKIDKRNFNEII